MKRSPVRYFRLNLSRMTVGELWRACEGNIVAFFVVLPSKIGLGIFTPPYAAAIKTAWISIDPELIPRAAMKRLSSQVSLLQDEGFSVIDYGETPLLEKVREMYSVLMLSKDGLIGVGVFYLREPNKIICAAGLTTRCHDGTHIITSSERKLFNPLKGRSYQHYHELPADHLYAHHVDRLTQAEAQGASFTPYTAQQGISESIRMIQEWGNHLVERGVLVEIPDDEVEDILWHRGDNHGD